MHKKRENWKAGLTRLSDYTVNYLIQVALLYKRVNTELHCLIMKGTKNSNLHLLFLKPVVNYC